MIFFSQESYVKRMVILRETPRTKMLIPHGLLLRYVMIPSKEEAYPTKPDVPTNSMKKKRHLDALQAWKY